MTQRAPSASSASALGLGLALPYDAIRLCLYRVELFPQHLVPLDRIAPDLLIGVRRHSCEIANVRRNAGLPIPNRLIEDPRENRLRLGQGVGLSARAGAG